MRPWLFFLLIIFSKLLAAQTVLKSPAEAKKYPNLDLQNIRWETYQTPHYTVTGFDKTFLESNFYELTEYELAEKVLYQKINLYRSHMGLNKLDWNQIGADVSRVHSKELSELGYISHNLNGKTPTDRMQPKFSYRIEVMENLNHFGGTMLPESVDSFTDYVLACWMNSSGHNRNLLDKGNVACAAIYCRKDIDKNEHFTVSAFSIIHKL